MSACKFVIYIGKDIWVCASILIFFSCPNMFRMSEKGFFLQLGDFRHVRRFFTHDTYLLVTNALVSSRLD